ncbi:MAG: ABC-2 transporter permease [Clostridium sp.]|nr:ABC-2 transporter permease [Clostridium sp.]
MKGLVIKDLMCLRKQRLLFLYTAVGVLAVSVMFVLSARFGNLAAAGRAVMTEQNLSEADVQNAASAALVLFLLLPIAAAGDVTVLFRMDGKAGFAAVSASLPLTVERRVLSRYLTVFCLSGIGVLTDLAIALALSMLTDLVTFADLWGSILSAAGLMSIYGSLAALFCRLLGYGKEDYAALASWAVILLAACLANLDKITSVIDGAGAGALTGRELLEQMLFFIRHRYYVLCAAALLTAAGSYLVSVRIGKRKGGV